MAIGTRIEFASGGVVDGTDAVAEVVERLRDAFAPVSGCPDAVRRLAVGETK